MRCVAKRARGVRFAARCVRSRSSAAHGQAGGRGSRRADRAGSSAAGDAAADLRFRPGLAVIFVGVVLRRVLEVADALADPAADLGQTARSEDQDDDRENDEELGNAYTAHMSLSAVGV